MKYNRQLTSNFFCEIESLAKLLPWNRIKNVLLLSAKLYISDENEIKTKMEEIHDTLKRLGFGIPLQEEDEDYKCVYYHQVISCLKFAYRYFKQHFILISNDIEEKKNCLTWLDKIKNVSSLEKTYLIRLYSDFKFAFEKYLETLPK